MGIDKFNLHVFIHEGIELETTETLWTSSTNSCSTCLVGIDKFNLHEGIKLATVRSFDYSTLFSAASDERVKLFVEKQSEHSSPRRSSTERSAWFPRHSWFPDSNCDQADSDSDCSQADSDCAYIARRVYIASKVGTLWAS